MMTLYEILEVPQSATASEIKDAYRRQAMKWHPDRNPNNRVEAEERFKKIAHAYRVLSDPTARAAYDSELRANSQYQGSSTGSDQGMSDDDADRMFFEQMLDLAYELASRGYAENLIAKALIGLDCPEAIAKTVAAQVTRNRKNSGGAGEASESKRQKSVNPTETNSSNDPWHGVKPYLTAALVGPGFVRSENDSFTMIKIVRFTLFIALSAVLFSLLIQGNGNNSEAVVNSLILSVLCGWGVMFFLLDFSPTHRHYLQQERINNYLPMFEQMFRGKKKWEGLPSAVLFPAPWFGYYGILWPLIAVGAAFFTFEFLILVNVNDESLANKTLISAYELSQKPWGYMVVWVILGYSFNAMLYRSFKEKIDPYLRSNNLDEASIYKACRPRSWRAILATVVFLLATSASSIFIFPEAVEDLNAAIAARGKSPQQLYEMAMANKGTRPALVYARMAANEGDVSSQYLLGHVYLNGKWVAKDLQKGIHWLEMAAKNGNTEAHNNLGDIYYAELYGVQKNEAAAIKHWRLAAEKGQPNAQVSVGWSYMQGLGGLPVDYGQAVHWNTLGAKNGHPEGFNNLGWLYEHGKGVPQDVLMAMQLYRKASEMGVKEASERLAVLVERVSRSVELR